MYDRQLKYMIIRVAAGLLKAAQLSCSPGKEFLCLRNSLTSYFPQLSALGKKNSTFDKYYCLQNCDIHSLFTKL